MLDQRRRRWTAVVQVLYKCFVFAGMLIIPLLQNISENLAILLSSISDILCCDGNDSTAVKYIWKSIHIVIVYSRYTFSHELIIQSLFYYFT